MDKEIEQFESNKDWFKEMGISLKEWTSLVREGYELISDIAKLNNCEVRVSGLDPTFRTFKAIVRYPGYDLEDNPFA